MTQNSHVDELATWWINALVTAKEKQQVREALRLLSGPLSDRSKGWKILSELAGLEPGQSGPFSTAKDEVTKQKTNEFTD